MTRSFGWRRRGAASILMRGLPMARDEYADGSSCYRSTSAD